MAIEYAPYIDGVLPAYVEEMRIPFRMSPAVSPQQVKGFCVKIMDLDGRTAIHYTVTTEISKMLEKGVVTLKPGSGKEGLSLSAKNFYKIQLAYMSYTTESASSLVFSTVGVIKRTNKYSYSFSDFSSFINNLAYNSFRITLTSEDCNEPIYSYQFKIYDTKGNLFFQTKELLHNVESDNIITSGTSARTSVLECLVNKVYNHNTQYKIYCNITTINNYTLSCSGPSFIPQKVKEGNIAETLFFHATQETISQDREEGRITIRWHGNIPKSNYLIRRTSSKDNFTTWDTIYSFAKTGDNKIKAIWDDTIGNGYNVIRDYTIEQGIEYRYYMVQYGSDGKIIAEQQSMPFTEQDIISPKSGVLVDFEYIYLTDKDRQLKVKYKGAISSLKTTIQEQKVDTIGSPYPFFYRNGTVKYTEIPISGLLSYLEDENQLFMSYDKLGLDKTKNIPTTALAAYNFKAERDFKLAVRDWLMNGKPKLLRSPGEGNYIVRLMNIQLTPEQGTSNMIHNFSATGYQIADGTYEDMKECGIVKW